MKIGSIITNVVIPATVAAPRAQSPLDQAMDALEIGAGLEIILPSKDGVAPTAKGQYCKVDSKKWAPKGKTFKIFQAEDQDGLEEGEVRFVIARVEFKAPVVRKKSAAVEAVESNDSNDSNEGEQY